MNTSVKAIIYCVAATIASAARPENIAGTTWTMQVNRDVEQLIITTQGGPGAPGAATAVNNSVFDDFGEYNFSATK